MLSERASRVYHASSVPPDFALWTNAAATRRIIMAVYCLVLGLPDTGRQYEGDVVRGCDLVYRALFAEIASILRQRRVPSTFVKSLQVLSSMLLDWLFPPSIFWRRSCKEVEQLFAVITVCRSLAWIRSHIRWTTARLTLQTLPKYCGKVLHSYRDFAAEQGYLAAERALSDLMELQRHAVFPVSAFVGHEACLYHWMSPALRYIGVARRDRVSRAGRSGVPLRWLEHLTFSNNRSLPGSGKLRYRLARREPLHHTMFMVVQASDVNSTLNREREALRQCRPTGNAMPCRSRRPRSDVARRRPPRSKRSGARVPVCRLLEEVGPAAGTPQHQPHANIVGTACSAAVSPEALGQCTYTEAYRRVIRQVADGTRVQGPLDIFSVQWLIMAVLWFGTRGVCPPWRLLERRFEDADVVLRLLPLAELIRRPRIRARARRCIGNRLRVLGLPGLTVHRLNVPAVLVPRTRRLIRNILWSSPSLSPARKRWWLQQTAVVPEPVAKWIDRVNAPRASRRADISEALGWSDDAWGRRAQGRRCRLVKTNWDIPVWESPGRYCRRAAETVRDWARDWRLNVPSLAAQCAHWERLFRNCRGTRCLEQERRARRADYDEFTEPLCNVQADHIVTKDDKQKRWCWHMPEPYYVATLVLYIVSSPHWSFTSLLPCTASLLVVDILALLIPGRLHRTFCVDRRAEWLPYMYTTLKSKCYDGGGRGRTCTRFQHSCARKIVSFAGWPARRAWRAVSRGLGHVLKHHGGSWEVWSLKDTAREVTEAYEQLSVRPGNLACVCARCRSPKPPVAGVVADAGQFFEVVKAESAVEAMKGVLDRAAASTGRNTIIVGPKGEGTYIAATGFACKGRQVWFSFSELLSTFTAAMKIRWCQVGDKVAQTSGAPIGGLCSKIAASAVLGEAERAWANDASVRTRAGFGIAGLDWHQLVACKRYVDDGIFISKVFCQECLASLPDHIYPIDFDLAGRGPKLDWLDMVINVNTCAIEWKPREAVLPPPCLVSPRWFRCLVLGRTARWRELGLSREATCSAAAALIWDLQHCGMSAWGFRHLFFSTRGPNQHFHLLVFRKGLVACKLF
ncbi:unnamed protein product [Prorocentrum cordatum]|uniref:Uncharacterized protein n=1 Tax=Prorocentrum cordatum TaxID=2364126 RepID=A0ABN9Y6Y8_9DINO|nr:unnamed protein product [Polarella glacialis]